MGKSVQHDDSNAIIIWTEYLRYKATVREFRLSEIEKVLRYSTERYFDTVTHRFVVVGKCDDELVMIPFEREGNEVTPITVHVITRQQIRHRQLTGRFENV